MRHIYLDHHLATPVLPEVFEAMRPWFSEYYGNAASLHQEGLRARDAIAQARAQTAALIHAASPDEIVFTSDGTESANWAIKGMAWASQRQGNHLVVSATEHPAILNSVAFLETQGFQCTRVGVDPEGRVDPAEVHAAITDQTILIAVHHANADIGTIEPIAEIGRIAAARAIPFYVDAEASAGWLPIDVQKMGASMLSFSPHKIYGPKGVGVLYRQRKIRLVNLLHGGQQEGGRRAGTENIAGIVGAGKAAEIALEQVSERMDRAAFLQQKLWNGLQSAIPGVQLNGPPPGPLRLSTLLNISFDGIEGEALVLLSDMHGIAISSGTACLSKALAPNPVLRAIGLSAEKARGSVILSLGADNTESEVDAVIEVMPKLVTRLRELSPSLAKQP